ncbi:MAG: hypothetical protein NVSMB26_01140 [Beijerinckiaceae bacterium]
MKQEIPLTDRIARMADDLARNPVSDCQLAGSESVGASQMRIFTYRQGSERKQIWIGGDDQLPHLFKASNGPVSVTMKVNYGSVAAPLP